MWVAFSIVGVYVIQIRAQTTLANKAMYPVVDNFLL